MRRERWTRHRGIAVTGGLVGFYVTYVAYRNLKTVVPLLLPARGPIYHVPQDFADLPHSHAAYLQERLLVERREFLSDPHAAEVGQNIAAFASLHCSLLFTAALAAHLLGLSRTMRIALWVLFVVSAISTVHLGWHYVIDDVAGIAIGLLALGIACYMTGFQGRDREVPAAN